MRQVAEFLTSLTEAATSETSTSVALRPRTRRESLLRCRRADLALRLPETTPYFGRTFQVARVASRGRGYRPPTRKTILPTA